MKHFRTPLFLCSLICLILSISFSISPVSAADCVIPDSGPWPPCATGGGSGSASASPSNNQNSNNECVIPTSGPWPPCATSGGASNSQPSNNPSPSNSSSNDGDCVIPSSGPWPPCATSGRSTAPAPTEPAPQPTPESAPVAGSGQLVIDYIFYDGLEKRREGDEYAVIKNVGNTSVNLAGWRLNAGDRGQDFRFPSYVLEPGASCRVYTDEIHAEHCGFSFGRNSAVWNNSGDCGLLYNSMGQLADEYCY